jgi:hypothetical protein
MMKLVPAGVTTPLGMKRSVAPQCGQLGPIVFPSSRHLVEGHWHAKGSVRTQQILITNREYISVTFSHSGSEYHRL